MTRFTCAMVSVLPRWFGVVAWLAYGMSVRAADAPIVIQGGTVFDSLAGELLAERTILIEGTKIKSVGGPHTPLSVPDGAINVIPGRCELTLDIRAANAWDAAVGRIPVRRAGRPDDIANLVIYLCSPEGSFINGQSINVCGGHGTH